MVGRAHPEDGIAAEHGLGMQRGQGHGGGGVARRRLQQQMILQPRVECLVLAPDQHRLARRRHRDQPLRPGHAEGPPGGDLQQRFLAEQLDQMLGEGGAAHRPQPGAGAAGQDGRHQIGGECLGHAYVTSSTG